MKKEKNEMENRKKKRKQKKPTKFDSDKINKIDR